VDELIGPDTVNTIPPATFDAFREHGKPGASLESDLAAAHEVMKTLAAVGISISQVTDELIAQAVKMFAEPFAKLLNALDAKRKFVAGVSA
jgi:transaldolase/glucose-6-phosphate isomerase